MTSNRPAFREAAKPGKRRREAGQALVFVTFGLAAFIAAAGLAIDMGYLRYERRLMQSAADSAALAAAMDINLGLLGQASADAFAVSQNNGFQDGVNNVTVTYNNPPAAPDPNAGNVAAAEVQVQRILPTFFMKIFGVVNINTPPISATAVASIVPSSGCIYVLGPLGLTLNGGINAPNCGVVDNGPLNGAGNIIASSVGVFVAGGGFTGTSSHPVETIVQGAADPLAYLTPPAPTLPCTPQLIITTPMILPPGTYCGITINSGGSVTFNPGLYVLMGTPAAPGLQISGTGTATGTDVTFYNTGTGAITFNGTGNITLSASTAGVSNLPPGILFYQDPANLSAADVSQGGATGNVNLSGTLYFPAAPLTIAGSLSPSANSPIVASSLTISGSTALTADTTSQSVVLPGGSPLVSVSVVE